MKLAYPIPARVRAAITALAVYALAGGAVSFLGWVLDLQRLADWDGDGITIQPNAALAGVAAALAAILLVRGHRLIAAALGILVALIGGSVLLEYATGMDLGVDGLLLFGREWGQAGVLAPGRMGPPGSVSWTLIGSALALASVGRAGSRARLLASNLAVGAVGICAVSLVGYLYGADRLYALPRLTVIALQTSTFVLATALAVILAIPERPPTRWLIEDSATGRLARRLLPYIIVAPLALGWVEIQGRLEGWYDSRFGMAVLDFALLLVTVGLISWNLTLLSRHEGAMQQSERRVTETLESITDGFVTLDREWRFTRINAHAERLLGKTWAQLEGLSVWEVYPEMVKTETYEELHRAATGKIPVEFEGLNPVTNRWFANRAYPMPDGGLTVFFQDITERKRDEEALRLSRESLAAELAAMTRLQALSTRLVAAGDRDVLLREVLAAAADITGTSKGNIQLYDPATGSLRIILHQGLGKPFLEYFADHGCPSTCDAAARDRKRVVVEDVASEPSLRGTTDRGILLEDGIRAIQSTPLITRDGRLLGMLSNHYAQPRRPSDREERYFDLLARMAADIIERSSNEEALRASEQVLKDADRRKDDFLAILSHELRGPLAPIRNMLEVMARAEGDVALVRQAREMMTRQCDHLVRLVEDLLDVSRIARDKLELRRETVDLGAAITQAVEACRPLTEAGSHELSVTLPEEPILLDADPVRLVQVFSNLIGNACKYSDAGLPIALAAFREDGDAVVTVRDFGVGIPREKLETIFEMFEQVERPPGRAHGGLGLGLALARRLVSMHHGAITARSEGLGRGSTFTVRLPARPEQAATRAADEMAGVTMAKVADSRAKG